VHRLLPGRRPTGCRRAAGPQDDEGVALVSDLLKRSAEFRELWDRHDVAVRREDRKRLVHPSLGIVEVNCLNLLSEDGRQRLMWFTPVPGTAAVEQLELLAVLGTQNFSPRADTRHQDELQSKQRSG
jgi:hypothetical protein